MRKYALEGEKITYYLHEGFKVKHFSFWSKFGHPILSLKIMTHSETVQKKYYKSSNFSQKNIQKIARKNVVIKENLFDSPNYNTVQKIYSLPEGI